MASNQSTFILNLETKGMDKAQKQSQNIADNLQTAAKASQTLGTSGSRRVAASASGGAMAAIGGREVEDYNRARGAAGAAGGTARDFADQARGLGGLVRLYATFAANAFAAAAAFGALSRAMDTTNMVKGLDQLGAASGRNLGQLSKRLVEATDGAISLRDAMEATAKTSAAGMSGQNIERLAKIAKNASLALGVSMPDALSRLSRGVTKLEPELLDELGLFTKIEPAVQAYAREVGKTASQLTDFERRQAFANAVIKEGEEKFSALADAAANPYDKLLANLKNVAQSGLELVNNVLSPIVSLLASSPTTLALALGTFVSLLLKQAIPAIGQFRAGLATAAEESLEAAKGKAGEALAAREQLNRVLESKVEASADAQVRAVEDAEKRMLSIRKDSINKTSAVYKLLKKDLVDIDDKDIAAAEQRFQRLNRDPARKEEAAASRQVIDAIKGQISAEQDLIKVKEKNRQELNEAAKSWSVYGIVQQKATDYELKARKQAIVSNAAYNASLIGPIGAMKLMNLELQTAGLSMNRFGTATLFARAALASLAGAIGTVLGALNAAMGAIAVIVGAFALLQSFLSKNGKEMGAFDSAVESATGSVENINRTLDLLKSKGGFATATIEGISAMANAFGEAADSAQALLSTSIKAKDAASGWDKFWDGFYSFFGGGIDKNLAKALSGQLLSSLDILKRSDLNDKYTKVFQEILNVGSLDFDTVSTALEKADRTVREKFVKALQNARIELANSSSRLQSFKTATDNVVKSYQEFIQITASTDPLFKLGASLENLSTEMGKLASGGIREIEAGFLDLAKSPEKIATFGSAFTEQFIKLKDGFLDQISVITQYRELLITTDKDIANFTKQLAEIPENIRTDEIIKKRKELTEKLDKTQRFRESLVVTIDLLPRDKIEAARGLFVQGIESSFAKSAELIKTALGNAAEKAKLTVEKARINILTGEARASAENRLALQEIDLQQQAIRTNIDLIRSQERLIAAINLSTAVTDATKTAADVKATPEQKQQAENIKTAAEIYKQFVDGNDTLTAAIAKYSAVTGKEVSSLVQSLVKVQASPLIQRESAQRAKAIEVRGQREAQVLTGGRQIRAGQAEDLEKIRVLNDNIIQQESTKLGILQSITGSQSESLIKQQSAVENTILESKFTAEVKDLRDKATEAVRSGEAAEAEKLYQQIELVLKRQGLERDNKGLQDRLKLLQVQLDTLVKQQEISKLYTDQYYSSIQAALQIRDAENQFNQENLSFSQEYVRQQQYLLEIQRLQTQEARTKAEAEAQYQAQVAIAAARKTVVGADVGAIDADLARERVKRDLTIAGAEQESVVRARILQLQKNSGDEQDRINRLMNTTKSISESLSTVFGEFGQKLGGLTEILIDVGLQLEKNAATEKKLRSQQTEAEVAGNFERVFELQTQIDSQKQKSVKDEISGNAKILGSAKTLFKEKTAAYKILGGIEKALHIARIAMDLKELATSLFVEKGKVAGTVAGEAGQTAATGAGFFARAGLYVTEIFSKISAQLGVFGPPVAAAIVAAIGLSAFGGNKSVQPGGFTAEEQQRVQGTSQYFDPRGKLQTREGGVLGDPTARSEVVAKGIEAIEKYSFETLESSNQMLDALRAIEKNTKAFTSSLLKAVPGLNLTPETLKSGGGIGGFLFGKETTETLDRGFKIIGNIGQIIDRQAQLLEYTRTKTTSGGGLFDLFQEDVSYGGDVAPITDPGGRLSKDLSKTFSSVITAVTAAANKIFTEINPEAVTEAFRALDLSEQLRVSLMGLKGTEAAEAVLSVISSGIDSAVNILFPSLEKFQQVGESMGDVIIRLANDMRVVTNSLTLMGFNLPVLQETVGTVTQGLLDRVTRATQRVSTARMADETLYDRYDTQESEQGQQTIYMGKFRGTEETARELTAALRELNEAQDAVAAATRTSTTRNLELIDSIINAFGGLENFTKSANFFTDNFLSESERLTPIRANVVNTFKDLSSVIARTGFETVTTSEQLDNFSRTDFKNLVLSLQDTSNAVNITTEEGLNLFKSLLTLAPAFAAVVPAAEDTSRSLKDIQNSIDNLNKNTRQLNAELLNVRGRTTEFKAAIRALETEGMTPAEISIYDLNTALRETIEVEKSLRNLNKTNRQLSAELLNAQGKTTQYQAAIKALETEGMTPAEIAVYDLNTALRETIEVEKSLKSLTKTNSQLNAELLNAQGKTTEFKAAIKALETEGMTPAEIAIYDLNTALRETIESERRLSQLNKTTADLNAELLNAEGKTTEFKAAIRALETEGMTPAEKTIYDLNTTLKEIIATQNSLNALKKTTKELQAELLNAQGKTTEFKAAIRALETEGMGPAEQAVYDFNNALRETIAIQNTVNGLNRNTKELRAELLLAQGKTREYRKAITALETEGMTPAQKAIYGLNARLREQITIQQQSNDLQKRQAELQGNTGRLRLQELLTLAPSNRYMQLRIWAMEDEKKALEEAIEAQNKLMSAMSGVREMIASIQNEMMLEEPDMGLKNFKQEFERLIKLSLEKDTEAIEKLNGSASKLLDSAKNSSRTAAEYNVVRRKVLLDLQRVEKAVGKEKTVEELLAEIRDNTGEDGPIGRIAKGIAVEVVAVAKSEIEKLIKFVTDTDELPEDLKELALSGTESITRLISFVEAEIPNSLTDDDKLLALLDATDTAEAVVRSFSLALRSDELTAIQKALILTTGTKIIDITYKLLYDSENSTLTEEQQELALSTTGRLSRVIELSLDADSKLTDPQRDLIFKGTDTIVRTVELLMSEDSTITEEDADIILRTSDNISLVYSLTAAPDSTLTSQQTSLILKDSDTIVTTNFRLMFDETNSTLTEEDISLLIAQNETVSRIFTFVSDPLSTLTSQEKNLILTQTGSIVRAIQLISSPDSTVPAEIIAIITNSSDTVTRTIELLAGSTTITADQKTALYAATSTISRTIALLAGGETVTQDQRRAMYLASDTIQRTVDLLKGNIELTPEESAALVALSGVVSRTVDLLEGEGFDAEEVVVALTGGDTVVTTVVNGSLSNSTSSGAKTALTGGNTVVDTAVNGSLSNSTSNGANTALTGGNTVVDTAVNGSLSNSTSNGANTALTGGDTVVTTVVNGSLSNSTSSGANTALTGGSTLVTSLVTADLDNNSNPTALDAITGTSSNVTITILLGTAGNNTTALGAVTGTASNATVTVLLGNNSNSTATGAVTGGTSNTTVTVGLGANSNTTATGAVTGGTSNTIVTVGLGDNSNTTATGAVTGGTSNATVTILLGTVGNDTTAVNAVTGTASNATVTVLLGNNSNSTATGAVTGGTSTATVTILLGTVGNDTTAINAVTGTASNATVTVLLGNNSNSTATGAVTGTTSNATVTILLGTVGNDTIALGAITGTASNATVTVLLGNNSNTTATGAVTGGTSNTTVTVGLGANSNTTATGAVTGGTSNTTVTVGLDPNSNTTATAAVTGGTSTTTVTLNLDQTNSTAVVDLLTNTDRSIDLKINPSIDAKATRDLYSTLGIDNLNLQISPFVSNSALNAAVNRINTAVSGITAEINIASPAVKFTPGVVNGVATVTPSIVEGALLLIKTPDQDKLGSALGNVFDEGSMVKFANGGAFTNSIVSSPVTFPLGLMGEAGPEAIMPLERGPDGSLGVTNYGVGTGNQEELLKELINQVIKLRNEVQSDVSHNAKTARLLTRVIPAGDSIQIAGSMDGGSIR